MCGQVGSGESATEQTLDCLARIDALLIALTQLGHRVDRKRTTIIG